MRSHSAPSVSCLETLFCESSESCARRGGFSYVIAEMSSLLLSELLPKLKPEQRNRLVLAGKYGRSGVNCSEVYDQCEQENINFINILDVFKWSPVADLKYVEKLVAWAYNKIWKLYIYVNITSSPLFSYYISTTAISISKVGFVWLEESKNWLSVRKTWLLTTKTATAKH